MVIIDWNYCVKCKCGIYVNIPFTTDKFIDVKCDCGKIIFVDLSEEE